jgi:hypothetical protein
MKSFPSVALLPALALGLALPAYPVASTSQPMQTLAMTGQPDRVQQDTPTIHVPNLSVRLAQSPTEQRRLPAEKEGAASNAGKNPSEIDAGKGSKASATGAGKSQGDTSRDNQGKAKKHPPTAVMDRAASPAKSPSQATPAAKQPPTSVMDRATPDQSSPGTPSSGSQSGGEAPGATGPK